MTQTCLTDTFRAKRCKRIQCFPRWPPSAQRSCQFRIHHPVRSPLPRFAAQAPLASSRQAMAAAHRRRAWPHRRRTAATCAPRSRPRRSWNSLSSAGRPLATNGPRSPTTPATGALRRPQATPRHQASKASCGSAASCIRLGCPGAPRRGAPGGAGALGVVTPATQA